MPLRPLILAIALATSLIGTSMTASAQSVADAGATAPQGTLLSVSAEASARRVPDVATISTGVVTQAADANAAMPNLTHRVG